MRTRAVALVAVVATALCAALASASDPELAKFLVKQGRTALEKGQADDAIAKFVRAREEDPDTIEASWWIGQASEKKADGAAAIDAYRRYLEDYDVKRAAGRTTAEEAALAKKAQARLNALATGESEFRLLEDRYVGQLLAFAQGRAAKDPAIAERAVRLALDVAPDSPDARKALDSLAKKAPSPPEATTFPGIRTWADLIATRAYPDSNRLYPDEGGLVVDLEGAKGSIGWTQDVVEPAERFVLEMDVRIVEEKQSGWLVGFAFGRQGDDTFAGILQKASVTLTHLLETGEHEDLAEAVVGPIEPATWHRFAVDVEGTKARLWLDGKKVLEHALPGRERIEGGTGHWQQRCKAEYRVMRLGTRE